MRRLVNRRAGKLTRRAFTEMFGFTPKRPLRKKQRQRADEINKLFDLVHARCGITSYFVFKAIGADENFCEFAKNVRTCPKKALEFCRAALAPDSWLIKR
jgi:hypothetical protein